MSKQARHTNFESTPVVAGRTLDKHDAFFVGVSGELVCRPMSVAILSRAGECDLQLGFCSNLLPLGLSNSFG